MELYEKVNGIIGKDGQTRVGIEMLLHLNIEIILRKQWDATQALGRFLTFILALKETMKDDMKSQVMNSRKCIFESFFSQRGRGGLEGVWNFSHFIFWRLP